MTLLFQESLTFSFQGVCYCHEEFLPAPERSSECSAICSSNIHGYRCRAKTSVIVYKTSGMIHTPPPPQATPTTLQQ